MAMCNWQGRALRNCPVGNFSKGASLQGSKKLVFSDAFSLLLSFGMEKNRGEHLRDELGEAKVRRKKKTKILKVTTEKTKERYLRFKINQVIKRKPQFDEVQEVYFPNTEQNHCFIVLCSEQQMIMD